jgi:hypothetical protein
VDASQSFLDVKLSRLALRIVAIPIEEAESRITGLLHFRQQNAATNGMNRARRKEDAITWFWLETV